MTQTKKTHFGQMLKSLRDRAGLSQEQLAAAAGVSNNTVSNWETSDSPSGHRSTLKKLADALGIPVDRIDAMWRDGILGEFSESYHLRDEDVRTDGDGPPIVGHAGAGRNGGVIEQYVETIPDADRFRLRIYGDSMEPEFQDGNVIECSRSEWQAHGFINGRFYVVALADGITFKQVYTDPDSDQISLVSRNPIYAPTFVRHSDVKGAARVVFHIERV